MKRIVTLLVVTFAFGCANAQKLRGSDIPPSAKQTFTQKFPDAKDVKWEKEDDGSIEAEFKSGKSKYSATFDQAGKWLETESEIKKSELPGAVLATITKEFSGFKIEDVERLETPDQGKLFEVKLEKKEISYEVQFNETGKVIKKEKEEKKDEKKKD